MAIVVIPVSGYASEEKIETLYFEDGSYMTVEIEYNLTRTTWSVTGNKKYTYYDDNGSSQWYAVLTGSFNYTGSSSSCTSSNVNVTIYDSSWYTISKSASKSGNKATGSATVGQKVSSVTITRVPVNLTLSCDANGNLS